MPPNKFWLFLVISLLVFLGSGEEDKEEWSEKEWDEYIEDLVEKILAQITKMGAKILVNPKILRTTIKQMVEKLAKKSLTKSVLKKIPVVGAIAGIGFGAWRAANGEYKRALAEVVSGVAGATGFGVGPSIVIDVGIIIADIVDALEEKGFIQMQTKKQENPTKPKSKL